jgi:Cd2+/Zn2+-exporting ATPase
MIRTLRLDLSDVLPELTDPSDPCIGRLARELCSCRGILGAHVITPVASGRPRLCVHFDPAAASEAEVTRRLNDAAARVHGQVGHLVLPIRVVAVEDAGRRVERQLKDIEGVIGASASLAAQRVRVEFDRSRTDADRVRSAVRRLKLDANGVRARPSFVRRNRELLTSLLAGVVLVVAFTGERWMGLPAPLTLVLYGVTYALGGFGLLWQTLRSITRGHVHFDIDLLMLLAAAGAAAIGEFAEGALLLFLFALANALEHYALGRARNAIAALGELAPAYARVIRGRSEELVPVEDVPTGTRVLVRPGERIPVDGRVDVGQSAVNQAPITGESVPVDKAPGDDVFAGTVNGEGAIEVTTTRAPGDRTLDRIITLVAEAQTQKAPTQNLTERFERVFVPFVLVADALLIVVPPLAGWWTWDRSIYTGMAMLTGASPCALALGTPAAVLAGIAQAARRGVLIKGGAHLENLAGIKALAVDKTGTITTGRPEVTDVVPLDAAPDGVLRVAAAVERQSQHPLAAAIVRHAEGSLITAPDASPMESVTARGVRATVEGELVEIGSLRMWDDGVTVPDTVRSAALTLQEAGRSVVIVKHGTRWLGVIGVADRPRPDVHKTVTALQVLGVRPIVMLTGDNRGVGEAIAREVGIDEVRADLLPEDKVEALRTLRRRYGDIAMVGDGVNDAPALAQATVGIAMGAAGTAAALEAADVALMNDDLGQMVFAIGLARRTRRIIRQNLAIALGVIAVLMVATVSGLVGLGVAVFFHEGSTLVVIANALRLLTYVGPDLHRLHAPAATPSRTDGPLVTDSASR